MNDSTVLKANSTEIKCKMKIPPNDKFILRRLTEKVAEIADLPVHQHKADLWRRLNGLEKVRPLVWINEFPWHEMDVNGELTLQCENDYCRWAEQELRRAIYLWQHAPFDMVVENVFYSPLVIHDSGFGITEDVDFIKQDEKSNILSRGFHQQIQNEQDIEKIKMPVIHHDENASEENFEILSNIFGDILPVKKRGIVHQWFAPWDELIRWWDVQDALMDLVTRPDLIHLAMERLISAYLCRLDQYTELNLLSYAEGNFRVGSGGLGYTDELPKPGFNPNAVRTTDLWGCATAQIFCDVSPAMHEEFALQYERRWLERFGLNYYGCCEPLHHKMSILKSIPNLRKISISPWADLDKAAANIGENYVISYKPNPAVLATDNWNLEAARKKLVADLEKLQDCVVEIIMKDISTVQYQPQRLWEWAHMAMEVVEGNSC